MAATEPVVVHHGREAGPLRAAVSTVFGILERHGRVRASQAAAQALEAPRVRAAVGSIKKAAKSPGPRASNSVNHVLEQSVSYVPGCSSLYEGDR